MIRTRLFLFRLKFHNDDIKVEYHEHFVGIHIHELERCVVFVCASLDLDRKNLCRCTINAHNSLHNDQEHLRDR